MEAYLKVLIETHTKANRLSKEIRKHRGNIIKAYKNKSSSDLYISKINYTPLVAELNKETATFNELLKNLEENDFINNYNDTNSEIIENSNSDISVDTNISQKSYDTNTISNYTNDETKLDTETSNTPVVHIHLNDIFTDNTQIKPAIIPAEPINKPKAIKKCKKDSNDYLSLVKNKDVLKKTKNTKRISGVKSGYKYNGKGFEVFTGYRNKCQPIYSSTMLYCKETCNEDKDELIKYLIKFGYFNNKMIEDITFTRGYYKRHALIKVRGELKYITKKIKQLNKANKDKKTEIDGLIIYYSGHGCSNDWMFCSNGELLSFYEIKNEFQEKKCKILASKPKLFYFDCCRGHKGISVDQLNSAKGNKVHSIQTDDEKLDICDYLVHYSSAPEYQSYQTGEGSYLIDAIYEKYKTHKELVSITKDIQETVIKKSGNTEMAPIHNALKKNLYLIDYNEKFSVETIYETTDASINSNRNDDGRVHGNENDIISKELAHVKLSDDKTTLIVNPIAGSAKNTDNYGAFTIKSFHVSCSSDTINTPIMQDMMGIVFYYWFDNMNTDTNRKGQQYEYFTFAGNTCQPAYILLVNSSRLAPGKKNKKTDPISGSTYHGKAFNYWTGEKWEDQKFNGLICGGFAIQNGKYKFNSATFNIPSYDGYHDVGFHQDKNTAAYVQGNQRFLKEMSDKECVCIKAALDNWKKYKTSKQNTYVTEIASSEEWKRKFG
eukprot:94470_1